eukprot:TRINITY_DN13889_c0_g1_i1.p1 TRINITY_DN13889_c0_g1~~TRINITY_DN13889_c0_g1_i1.p1  ORF type:complete len:279 (-),score=32.55 TRINITY_DN13889_c0_g1_i1:141-977(-)
MKLLLFLYLVGLVCAHMRWKCPAPRSEDTGIKQAPCGSFNDTTGHITEITPGLYTVYWEESISHKGAPFRISLAVHNDTYSYVLVDHIPHNDEPPNPTYNDPSTYKQYRLTIRIPDIDCNSCSLQIVNPMTDKIPIGANCTDPGTCTSVYHSCANVKILGSTPVSEWKYIYSPPINWTYALGGPYTQESGNWTNGWLLRQDDVVHGNCLSGDDGLSPGAIFGIVVLVLVVVIIFAFVIVSLFRRHWLPDVIADKIPWPSQKMIVYENEGDYKPPPYMS